MMESTQRDYNSTIRFGGGDSENTVAVNADHLKIICSPGTHDHGSSKLKFDFDSRVNYNWEVRYYPGQLIAVHQDKTFYAYSMTIKGSSMVRIGKTKSTKRTLIKDLKDVVDLAFALITKEVILAFVDEEGYVAVYNVEEKADSLEASLLLQIMHTSLLSNPVRNLRLIWCPYIPAEEEDSNTVDDPAKLLALLVGKKVEIWDVSILVNKQYKGIVEPGCSEGYMEIEEHPGDVTDAAFSPDATVIATACSDGCVKFFQIYQDDTQQDATALDEVQQDLACTSKPLSDAETPRCLHSFVPHDHRPLSCLFFLDSLMKDSTNGYWKFLVTGAENNSVLKIWSCKNWEPLQTITFLPNMHARPHCGLFFKVRPDPRADYIIMTEINNRLLYVLHLYKNEQLFVARVTSVSEFLLPSQILSFHIIDAKVCKLHASNSNEDLDDQDEYEDEPLEDTFVLKMFVIEPKQFGECTITYQPDVNQMLQDSSDTNKESDDVTKENGDINNLQSSVALLLHRQTNQLNLMTPDAFSSPPHNSSPSSTRNSLVNEMKKSVEKLNEMSIENLIDLQRRQKDNFASGGSSPSREVQQILSLNESTYGAQEYLNNLAKSQDETEIQNDFNQTENLMFTESVSNIWPNIPIVKASEMVKEENRRQELLLGSGDDGDNVDAMRWNKAQLQTITFQLNSLENMVREQNIHIQKLQHEIANNTQDSSLQDTFAKQLEVAMTKYQLSMAKMFENYINLQKSKDREMQESLIASLSQLLSQQLPEKLQNIIVQEIKHVVLPAVMSVFENLKHQLDIQYSQKLNSTDHLLRDNIAKLVSSKALADSLSLSVVSVIKPSLEQCYKDMIVSTLIPSWERICSTMFQQIHETFTQGTKEYTASVEVYMDRQRRVQDKGKDLITQMQSLSESMKNNTDKLTSNLAQEIHRQFNLSFISMQDKLSRNIADLVGEQIKQGFKSHAAVFEDSVINAVRSRAVTPSPHVIDSQVQLAQVQQLISKGNIEAAFQQALSASDLALVTHVCERVDPQEVFKKGGCILQQHVLLSLIQQLSADLAHNTEVKHKYLEEALLYLEMVPITNEHIPIILRDLTKQLSLFVANCPSHKFVKNMKMLLLATQSLLKQ